MKKVISFVLAILLISEIPLNTCVAYAAQNDGDIIVSNSGVESDEEPSSLINMNVDELMGMLSYSSDSRTNLEVDGSLPIEHFADDVINKSGYADEWETAQIELEADIHEDEFKDGEKPVSTESDPADDYSSNEVDSIEPLFASSDEAGEVTYSVDIDTGVLTISGTGNMENYSSANNTPWYADKDSINKIVVQDGITGIGHYAFAELANVTEVSLPDSVKSIGFKAFYNCKSLSRINIPIGWEACPSSSSSGTINSDYCGHIFEGCISLKNITVPNGMISLPSYAFCYSDYLETISLPNSINLIRNHTFYRCESLLMIDIPDAVKEIQKSAFCYCSSLSDVKMGNTVESISLYAFYECKALGTITLPDTVKSIGYQAFYNCTNLVSVNIPLNWEDCPSSDSSGKMSTDYCGHIFQGCKSLKSLTVPDGMTSLPSYALCYSDYVENVYLPESINVIKNHTFYQCRALKSIDIPDAVTEIQKSAFCDCSSITKVNIGDKVEKINLYAFNECRALESIVLPDTVKSIGFKAFYGCTNLSSINIPMSWEECPSSSDSGTFNVDYCGHIFQGCSKLKTIVLPEGMESIPAFAFTYANYVETVSLPSSLKVIKNQAFYGCSKLKNVDIPSSVEEIWKSAFYDCSSITEIMIPEKVSRIPNYAFYGCSSLMKAQLPDSITSIGYKAFYDCSKLESINYPLAWSECGSNNSDGSKSASDCGYIFTGCKKLVSIVIPEGVVSIPDYAFNRCDYLSTIELPQTVKTIGKYAFSNCTSLVIQDLPESLNSIGEYSYQSCTSLRAVEIPSSLEVVEPYTFSDCINLQAVTIPDSVTSIDKNAFSGANNITNVFYGGNQEKWDSIAHDSRLKNGNISYETLCNYTEADLIRDSGYVRPENSKFDSFYGGYASVNGDSSSYRLVDLNDATFGPERNELFFSLPKDSYVTYGFDNAISCPENSIILLTTTGINGTNERADVYIETLSGKTIFVDTVYETSDYHSINLGKIEDYIVGIKFIGRDLGGNCPGFDIVNFAVMAQKTDIVSPIMSNTKVVLTRGGKAYDLFSEEQKFELNSEELATISVTPFWDNHSKGKIALTQDGKKIIENGSGAFVDIKPGKLFKPSKKTYVELYDADDQYIDRRELKLTIIDATVYSSSIPKDKYRFRVKNESNSPLEGVKIKFQYQGQTAQEATTDINGCADFDLNVAWGLPFVEATKDNYMTWTNENMNWNLSSSRYEEIFMYPDSAEYKYRLRCANYETDSSIRIVSLLRETKTLYLSNVSTIGTDSNFRLVCSTWDPSLVKSYKLYQESKEIATSNTGTFALNTRMFSEGSKCEVLVEPSDGSVGVKTPINLKFSKKQDEKIEFTVGKNTKFTVGQDVPVFGGSELSFDFPVLPVDFLISDEKVHLGINLKGLQDFKDKDKRAEVKKQLEGALKAVNTPMNKSSIKDLVKEYKGGTLPGFDNAKSSPVEWNVVGYLEAGFDDTVATGMLYFELSAKANPNWTFVVVVVPVVVDLELSVGAKAGGEIRYNWKTKNFDGRIFFDPKAGVELFGGVGVGKAVGVGVYGGGEIEFQINVLDSNNNTGLRKVDLTGQFGGKAYLGPFEYKKAWAYQTWNLYTATNSVKHSNSIMGMHSTDSLFGATTDGNGDGFFDYKMIEGYHRADLSYLSQESPWNSTTVADEINVDVFNGALYDTYMETTQFDMDVAPFENLLTNTYQNASPVVVSDGKNAWMAVLRADQNSGDVYVALSKYDGSVGIWSEPIRVDNNDVLDDKPNLICTDNDLYLVYSQAKASYRNSGDDVLEYAKKRQIRLLKIDKNTLTTIEDRTYTGNGFLSGQTFSLVDGKPVLAYSDSKLIDKNSVFTPPETDIYMVDISTDEKRAVKYGETSMPVDQVVPGKYSGSLSVGYVTSDGGFYIAQNGSSKLVTSNVSGRVSYDFVPGKTDFDYMWNGNNALCLLSGGEIAADGITNHYDVEKGTLFYSASSKDDGYKTVLKQTIISDDAVEISTVKCFDERYFENLSAFTMDGDVYIVGMNTSVNISYNDVDLVKDLVWTKLSQIHDLRIANIEYDDTIISAGEVVPVMMSIENLGEETVTGIEVSIDNQLVIRQSVDILPGSSTDIAFEITCPEEMTTYNVTVAETGITESGERAGDNSTTITMSAPDLSVDADFVLNDGQKGLSIVVQNEGGSKAKGTLSIFDKYGKEYYSEETVVLDTDDIQVFSVWVPETDTESFNGTITAELSGVDGDLFDFNNKAVINTDWNDEGSDEGEVDNEEQAAAPVATPVSGIIRSSDTISLSSTTKDAIIYYTTDGTTPTGDSRVYTEPIVANAIAVDNRITIKALAVAEGYSQSDLSIFAWSIGEKGEEDKHGDEDVDFSLEADQTDYIMIPGEVKRLSVSRTDQYIYGVKWTLDSAYPKGCVTLKNGIVTAKKAGTAKVTATYGSSSVTFNINVDGNTYNNTVIQEGKKKYKITATKGITTTVGDTKKSVAIGIPANLRAVGKTINYKILTDGVCSVGAPVYNKTDLTKATKATFKITPLDAGATWILWSMTDDNGNKTQAATKVIVKKPITKLQFAEPSVDIAAGEGKLLTVTGTKDNTDAKDLSFSVKGKGVKVSKSGFIFGTIPGNTAMVTVRYGKATASIRVNVSGDKNKCLMLNKNTLSVTAPKPGSKAKVTTLKVSTPKKKVDQPEVAWCIAGSPAGISVKDGKVSVDSSASPGRYVIVAAPVDSSLGFNSTCCELVVR